MTHTPDTAQFFQLAYVCENLDEVLPKISDAPGETFLTLDVSALGGAPDAPVKRIALANVGSTNIEVIEIRTDVESIFRHALKDNSQPAFHHIGYVVGSQAEWDHLVEQIGGPEAAADMGHTDGFLSYLYVDRRSDLGHFVEYVKLEAGGRQLFASVPQSSLTMTR